MKPLVKSFIASLLLLYPCAVFGAEHNTPKGRRLEPTQNSERPRVPGRSGKTPSGGIFINYSASHICFDLPAEVDFLEIQIEDANGMMWTGMVCQEDPCVDTPVMTFPSHIYCTTETGITLSATLD